jgi:hypothetical protein
MHPTCQACCLTGRVKREAAHMCITQPSFAVTCYELTGIHLWDTRSHRYESKWCKLTCALSCTHLIITHLITCIVYHERLVHPPVRRVRLTGTSISDVSSHVHPHNTHNFMESCSVCFASDLLGTRRVWNQAWEPQGPCNNNWSAESAASLSC